MSRAGRCGFLGPYGSAPFSPTDIAGCVLWLKADAGITMDGANRVSVWADQSGNSNDATQATGARQPLYVAADADFNSFATVEFDQTRYLPTPSIDLTSDAGFTIVLTARRAASDPSLFVGLHRQAADAFTASGGNCLYTYLNNMCFWTNCQSANYLDVPAGLFPPASKRILIARTAFAAGLDSNPSLRFDAVEAAVTSIGMPPPATALPIWIGGGYSDGAGNALANGADAERIIYNRRLNDAECGLLEAYLSDRTGIPI